MISRLCLGTAQFGGDYGIANQSGQISNQDAYAILQFAKEQGIEHLDTAHAYGDSEQVIGEFLKERGNCFHINSKVPSLDKYEPGDIKDHFNNSLINLRQTKLSSYLVHQFDDYLENPSLWEEMRILKAEQLVGQIGFSLYSPDELEILFDNEVDFDVCQVPYSVFDRRFENYFDILKDKSIEVHARSIFLQGLAFLDPKELEEPLIKAQKSLIDLNDLSAESGLSVHALCLNFVCVNPSVDRVLIGIDSLDQLKKNLKDLEKIDRVHEVYSYLKNLRIDDDDVLMPNRWHKSAKRIKYV